MLNKKSWLLLTIAAVMTVVGFVGFGWGEPDITFKLLEPRTNEIATTDKPIIEIDKFADTIKDFPVLKRSLNSGISPVTNEEMTVEDQPVIPGINATRTVDLDGDSDICTTMTPQGVDVAKDYLITSAYDHFDNHNSVLYIQDVKTNQLLKTVVLDGRPHVGGLTYDDDHKMIWVCGRRGGIAEIFGIKLQNILDYDFAKTKKPIKYDKRFLLGSVNRASFVTYYKKNLYVGFFNPAGPGEIQSYRVNDEGNILGKSKEVNVKNSKLDMLSSALTQQKTLSKIQGIVFAKDYAFLSQSYGPNNSKLFVFKENLKKKVFAPEDAILAIKMPSHLEQISVHGNRMYLIFESSAYAYRNRSDNVVDRTVSIDLDQLVKEIKKKEGK